MPSILRRVLAVLAVVLPLAGGCAPAPVIDCDLVPITSMPIRVENRLLTVDIGINGQWARMVVDFGAERTTLSEAAAKRLGLPVDPTRISRSMGVGGASSFPDVKVERLVIGDKRYPIDRLAVTRFGEGLSADGLLGADVLLAHEVDIDAPGGTLTLYRLRQCPAAVPNWVEGYVEIAGVRALRNRLLVPIELDGAAGMSVLDTGAQISAIGTPMARRAGLTEAMLAADPPMTMRGVGAGTMQARLHRFRVYRIGPVVAQDVVLPVVPGDLGSGDGLIGQDFLAGRRVWLAFPTRRLFVSARGGGAAGSLIPARRPASMPPALPPARRHPRGSSPKPSRRS